MKYKGTISDPKDLVTKEWVQTNITTLKPMQSSWCGSNLTTAQAAALMFEDGVQSGEGYLGGVEWSDLSELGLGNAEVKAFVINDWIIQFEMTSSDTVPYAWFFNSAASTWRSFVPVENTLNSSETKAALSANQGRILNEAISSHTHAAVLYDQAQSLTDIQKGQARTNISAAGIVVCTQAEYDAMAAHDPYTVYAITS